MPTRTFADIDQTTPVFQRAFRAVNPWLAGALRAEGLPAERSFDGPRIAVDRPWLADDPKQAHLVDPDDPRDTIVARRLQEAGVEIDENGYPVYPHGDTGVHQGRGNANTWGPEDAGDGHITRVGPESGRLEILVGRREDNHMWATPGGMFDSKKDSTVADTIRREVREETGLDIDFSNAPTVYQGDALDDRRTNNYWIVTEARRRHLLPEEAKTHKPKASDDLTSAEFMVITPELLDNMHALHGQLVTFTIVDLIEEQPHLKATLDPALAAKLNQDAQASVMSSVATEPHPGLPEAMKRTSGQAKSSTGIAKT